MTKYHRVHVNKRWKKMQSFFTFWHSTISWGSPELLLKYEERNKNAKSSQFMELRVILLYWTEYNFKVQTSKVYIWYGLVKFLFPLLWQGVSNLLLRMQRGCIYFFYHKVNGSSGKTHASVGLGKCWLLMTLCRFFNA